MSNACPSCNRPVPLTADEVAILNRAACAPGGLPAVGLDVELVRALVRMGYVIKVANDDHPRRPVVLATERGRQWLAALA